MLDQNSIILRILLPGFTAFEGAKTRSSRYQFQLARLGRPTVAVRWRLEFNEGRRTQFAWDMRDKSGAGCCPLSCPISCPLSNVRVCWAGAAAAAIFARGVQQPQLYQYPRLLSSKQLPARGWPQAGNLPSFAANLPYREQKLCGTQRVTRFLDLVSFSCNHHHSWRPDLEASSNKETYFSLARWHSYPRVRMSGGRGCAGQLCLLWILSPVHCCPVRPVSPGRKVCPTLLGSARCHNTAVLL